MLSTYEEIEAEREKISAQSSKPFPPEAKAVMTAFMQYSARLPVIARCMHCGHLLRVTELGSLGSAWAITCPCERSKDTLRGL